MLTVEERHPDLMSVSDLEEAFYEGLRPPERLTVSEWADTRRFMDSRSPWPGQWRTFRVPYLKEIQDRMSASDPCQRVIFMKSAQVGGTECIHNAIGYMIEMVPGPMLAVQATVDMAKDWSKDRLQGLIDTTPSLQKLIGEGEDAKEKDSDNTIRYKRFPGGSLFIAGANSPSGLRSKPIQYLLLDEVDSYPESAGREGDPVILAERRTSNFRGKKKIILVSTPTIKGESRIEKAYLNSDQRRYFVPCPGCGHMQWLRWENITWPQGRPSEAFLKCELNGCVIEEWQKTKMLAQGEWRATNPGGGDGKTHGYHISSLYSPWKTWGDCAQEFVEAKPPGQPPNVEMLKAFINTVLGETWDDIGSRSVDAGGLMAKRQKWWSGDRITVPKHCTLITAGVDVQDDRIEGLVYAWAPGKKAYLIDRWVVIGDPSDLATWDDVDSMLDRLYPHESGIFLAINATCIDSRGHYTDEVYDYAAKHKSRRRWAIAGSTKGQRVPIWTGKASLGVKKSKRRVVYPVGVDSAKSWIYAALNSEEQRYFFPEDPIVDEGFFTQLCVEKKKVKYQNGRPVWYWWKPDHASNEMLDCSVYALAALEGLIMSGRKLDRVPNGVPVTVKTKTEKLPGTSSPAQVATADSPKRPPPVKPAVARGFVPRDTNWLRRG